MPYIGKEPTVGNFQVCDAISVVNGQAAYTMQVSSTNVEPESVNHMLVSLNGILQKPGSSFTINGATITFASNLATGDVIDFIILLGNVLDIGAPSDSSVTNAKLASDVISGETDIGGALADADLFLVDDGAGGTLRKTAASRIKTYVGSGLAEADQWRLTSGFTGTSWDFSSNMERADHAGFSVLGTGMSESSGVFTYPSTGYWLVIFNQFVTANTNTRSIQSRILTTADNSTYVTHYTTGGVVQAESNWTGDAQTNTIIQDVTNVSNDKVKFAGGSTQTVTVEGSSSANTTHMTFIKLGDT